MLTRFNFMTRAQTWVSVIAALVLAIPAVTLVASFVVFPILFFAAIAVVTVFWPVLIGVGYAVVGLTPRVVRLIQAWQMSSIMWLGTAVGLANWGHAGAAIGARNAPFLDVFLMPWTLALKPLLG